MLSVKNGKRLIQSLNFQLRLASSQVPAHKDASQTDLSLESNISIEKKSLTRGLSLNRFEKVHFSKF